MYGHIRRFNTLMIGCTELAEYRPTGILEDTMEDAEYITEEGRIQNLHRLYSNSNQEIHLFLK